MRNRNNDAVSKKSEHDLAECSYTTVRKNDRRCDSEQFASAELMFRVRGLRKANIRWQSESTTQEMYMGNVAMRGSSLVKLIGYPETDATNEVGRLSEEAISRTLQQIEEIAQIEEQKR